jgi:hypothetical protein
VIELGGYEYCHCPSCHADGYDVEEPFLWKGVVFGTGGLDKGYGDCMSCGKKFKSGSPVEITDEEAKRLSIEVGWRSKDDESKT